MRKFTNLMRFLTVVSLSLILVVGYAQKGKSPLSTKAPQQEQVIQPSTASTAGQSMVTGLSEEAIKKANQGISLSNYLGTNAVLFDNKPMSNEIYDPSIYPTPKQGGENFGSAVVIGALPYTDGGTTLGYLNDYDAVCPYTGGTAPDVVYSYTPATNKTVQVSLCNDPTNYDSKLYIMDAAQTVIACNDDYCSTVNFPSSYVSYIGSASLVGGTTYYIVVDGYGTSAGTYQLTVNEVAPCVVTCPGGSTPEGEMDYFDEGVDVYNGGCNSVPPVYSPIVLGQTICGKSNTFLVAGVENRDTDWYRLDLTGVAEPYELTWTAQAEFDLLIFIVNAGTSDCLDYTILGSITAAPCATATLTATVNPGVYWVLVMPSVFSGYPASAGPYDYVATLTGSPASGGSGCENLTAYGSATVDPSGLLTTISTCSFAGEYSTVSGAVSGETYQFTFSDLGTGAYITLTDAPGDAGNILAYGPSPLNYVSTITGTLYAHWSLDEFCTADGSCHTTTVQCTSCVEPCSLTCPPGGIAEGEGDIPDEGADVFNGGCNLVTPLFSPIADGQTICGNWNTFTVAGADNRDTDWFLLDLSSATENTLITWGGTAEFPYYFFILNGDCVTPTILAQTGLGGAPCVEDYAVYNAPPGIYHLWVGGQVFTGYPAGGDWDYTVTLTLTTGVPSPPNDECVNAEPITGPYPQTVTGTLVGATVDCPGVLDWNAVWYEISLPYATNQLTVDFCGTVGAAGQSFGIVYYDECGMCNDYIIGAYDFATCPDLENITIVWDNIVGPGTVFFPAYISAAIPFTLNVNVVPGAIANITPASFTKYAAPGGSTTDILTVGNTGGATLNYTATVNYGAKATATCYPQNLDYWTGTTTTAAKTQVSQINIFAGSAQGWAQFDVSSIPVDAVVTSISLNWYVNTANCPFQTINALSVDPVTADPATLYSAITGGIVYNDYSLCPPIGWNTVTLGGNANADLTAALATGKFGVGFYEYETDTYYWTADGWAEVNKPYITVTYTTDPLWLTIDGAQSTTGSVIGGGSQPYTIGFDATNLTAGTYNGDITFVTNEPGAKASHIVPVMFQVGYQISGFVYYGDINNLKPQATMTTVTATPGPVTLPSGAGGAYVVRPLAGSTVYDVIGNSTKAWLGLNAPDASFAQQYILGTRVLTNLQKRAADVNLSGTIQSLDVTMIKRRILGQTYASWVKPTEMVWDGPFVPGWHGVSPTWIQTGLSVPVVSSNVIQDVRCLFSGDVNESGTPVPNP